ncbi:CD109 antigen-like isoform X2 [Homarus americanus]|uniref:CD109 antigen-like isoform X2 n=1 Tax=Homarus americanus TaxID=6706 RepID=UPI001C471C0B|nr:CD109 antigen-like isoform X2 [Homarus americanus]
MMNTRVNSVRCLTLVILACLTPSPWVADAQNQVGGTGRSLSNSGLSINGRVASGRTLDGGGNKWQQNMPPEDLERNYERRGHSDNNSAYKKILTGRRDAFNGLHSRASYIIAAPRLARPSTVYRLAVSILSGSTPVDVTAHMSSHRSSFNTARATISPGDTQDLLIKVPKIAEDRAFTLLVEGRRGYSLVFRNSTQVLVTPTFLTILMHLSRPCFTGGQLVSARVILLTTELKPYDEPVDAYILDPQGNIIKRWMSRMPHVGVVSVKYQLPELPQAGWWRVRVSAGSQHQETRFLVHKIYDPLYEVFVEMPFYGLSDDEEIQGTLTGSYLTDKPIYGNASLTLYVKQPWTLPDSDFSRVSSIFYNHVDVMVDFSFPMASLLEYVQQLEGAEVKVECDFYDIFTKIKAEGHSRMRILSPGVVVSVVGTEPFIFRPGMHFSAAVSVIKEERQPVEKSRLAGSSLVITPSYTTSSGSSSTLPQIIVPALTTDGKLQEETFQAIRHGMRMRKWAAEGAVEIQETKWVNEMAWAEREVQDLMHNYTREQYFTEYRETGIYRFQLDIPKDAATLRVDVVYQDEHTEASTTAHAYAHYHPGNRYVQVTSSTDEAKVGEFAIFHIRSNFPVHQFVYLIMSKGMLVHSAREVTHGVDVVTVSVAVASSMAPRFTLLVYVTTDDGEVLADAMALPVKFFNSMEVQLSVNQHKDHSKKTVEIVVGAPPGSFYALTCQRALNYFKQHPNDLTHTRILDHMVAMEPSPRTFHGVLHRSRDGNYDDRLVSLAASSYAGDVLATFQDAALILLTDAIISLTPGRERLCNITEGYLECGDGICFLHEHLCDGNNDCANGADELGCERLYQDFPLQHEEQEDPLELTSDTLFRLLRSHFIEDIFDVDDVEWCNSEIWIGHHGQEEIQQEIAKTEDEWVLRGYAIHPEHGLSFTKQPIFFASDPPFYIMTEAPTVCRRGEQISIRVLMFNLLDTTIQAVLLLHDSDDYSFVNVEKDGLVQYYKPRLSRGQHQHLVFIHGNGVKEVMLPLAVKRQSGMMEVTIEGVTQIRKDTETLEIEVKPEGVPVRKHTSLVLDLKNRALVYEFLEVPLDQSPIIPTELIRHFLFGSPAARISITVDHTQVFGGRHFRSTDGVAFNFGATLWTLHYLRLTNQLVMSEAQDVFDYLTVQLGGLLWRNFNGGFSMWAFTPPSVWLTAKVINILLEAQHEDWENLLFIDPKIIQKSVKFLLKYQMPDGGFREEGEVTLDSKMKKTRGQSSVPLTALVVTILHNSLSSLQGTTRPDAVDARAQATKFLEINLSTLDDCYHVALSAYALSIIGSHSAETAATMLNKMKRIKGDMTYWSRTPITIHRRQEENNQKSFLLPRELEQWDSHAIETTSYALLVFLIKEGVTIHTEQIMRWLNSVRDWDCAFMSTVDTVVAMQALAEYAFRARLRDITNMEFILDITAQPRQPYSVFINNSSTSTYHNFELENVWGHVNMIAKGSGQAIAQLDVSWGVDVLNFIEQPHKKYFELSVLEIYHQFRNKSLITTTVCARWMATEDGIMSSAALIEVEIPTGYMFFQPLADLTVSSIKANGSFPQLRNVHTTHTHVFWQFDYIPSDKKQCFSYDIQRWYPAANLTSIRSATVMELFAPEHFEMVMIDASPLAKLDICEVCGSYQCPYCPIYSAVQSTHTVELTSQFAILSLWLLLLLFGNEQITRTP